MRKEVQLGERRLCGEGDRAKPRRKMESGSAGGMIEGG